VKLLFDQNLSYKLAHRLADLFPDSTHVREVSLQEADDSVVWESAKQQGFMIVSKFGFPPAEFRLRIPSEGDMGSVG